MREDEPERPQLERIPTGIQGLDTVLGGGLLAGSVQLVLGQPGTGKTIFANQLAFNRAAAGSTAAYVTLLAESHARMLAHLGPISFFEPNMVSRRVLYMSGYGVLDQAGLDGLLELLTRTIREHSASLLIVDGLSTAKEFAQTTNGFKRFLLRLTTSASLTGCTTLLISSVGDVREAQPENATVDGIITLEKRAFGPRVVRELVVEKMRATRYALGPHAIEINTEGLHVYPRIESLKLEPHTLSQPPKRLGFGVPGLDTTLKGGVLAGSTTLVIGATGTGKTLLGSSFLAAGIERGEPGIFVGLRERPEEIIYQAESIGLSFAEAHRKQTLKILWFPTTEVSIDAVAWQLLELAGRQPNQRVFIDGVEGLLTMFAHPQRAKHFYAALITRLAACHATTLMAEVAPMTRPPEETVALMSPNNVLALSEVTKGRHTHRLLAALKVQGIAHDLAPMRLRITSKGLSLETPWLSRVSRGKL